MATAIAAKTFLLIILAILMLTSIPRVESATSLPSLSPASLGIPLKTDDGQDPITLIFTGYAPAWWVAANVAGWSDSAYCSGPKTVNGSPYNRTLEHPDPTGVPCYGPRDHLRIWDMGYSPAFGVWSIGSAHHEHTVCDPLCHHVIDSWKKAELDASSALLNARATVSSANYTLPNSGLYQSVAFDGVAKMIQLRPPSSHFPVIFSETGLSNETSWSVTVNGTTATSTNPDIVLDEPNGTYLFTVAAPQGFDASPPSGRMTVNGALYSQTVVFRIPWTTSTVTVNSGGRNVSIGFSGNATVLPSTVKISTGTDTDVNFTATERGPGGTLEVTIPGSVIRNFAHVLISVDGIQTAAQTTSNNSGTNVRFDLVYGTHSIELRFTSPIFFYLELFSGFALAATIMGVLLVIFRLRSRRKREETPEDSSGNAAHFHNP